MICLCPFCGYSMPEQLKDGLASCLKCNRVFDSSLPNKLLSASWMARQNKYHGIEQFISDTKLSEPEAIIVYSFVCDFLYSHDEFIKVLKHLGIHK